MSSLVREYLPVYGKANHRHSVLRDGQWRLMSLVRGNEALPIVQVCSKVVTWCSEPPAEIGLLSTIAHASRATMCAHAATWSCERRVSDGVARGMHGLREHKQGGPTLGCHLSNG